MKGSESMLAPEEKTVISVRFISIRDKRQFWINIFNAAVSWTALIKAFWYEISEMLQLIMR